MDLWVYSRRHPETAAAPRRFHARWRATIAAVIEHGRRRGEWGPVNASEAALRLAALTDGPAVHMVLNDPDHTREQYVAMALTAVALELGCDRAELVAAAVRCPAPG
jgi:hypothetical protein